VNFNNFSEISKARSKAKNNLDQHHDKFKELCYKALFLIKKATYPDSYNKDDLKLAVRTIEKALQIKKNSAEPYFYMACIGYLINDLNMSTKYLKIASSINPKLEGIEKLRLKIFS
jgi:hypothetical protein